jgi:hypothetical protein
MFILWFRTGENYNENTGLMQFDTASDFYNGAYGVTEVTNSFKQGSFTQTLTAYKDPMAQVSYIKYTGIFFKFYNLHPYSRPSI